MSRRLKVVEVPIRTTVDEAVADPALSALVADGYVVAYTWVKEWEDEDTGETTGSSLCLLLVPGGDASAVVAAVERLGGLQHRLENAVYTLSLSVALPLVLLALVLTVA